MAYLFDKTPYYRPWLRWIGVDIRRMGAEDMVSGLEKRGDMKTHDMSGGEVSRRDASSWRLSGRGIRR